MNDAVCVRVSQGAGDLSKNVVDLLQIKRGNTASSGRVASGIEFVFQRAAIHQLHYDIQVSVTITEVVNGHNVRMRELSNQDRFLIEAFHKVGVSRIPGRKNLHRNFTIKILLTCSIDMGHTSLTKRGKDCIVPKCCADHRVLLHMLLWRLSSMRASAPREDQNGL